MGCLEFEKLRKVFMLLFQQFQSPKGLFLSIRARTVPSLIERTSGFAVSFAAVANWLAAK